MNDRTAPSRTADPVRQLYARLADDDLAGALDLLHPDVVLHVPGGHDLAGDHAGRDAVVGFVLASGERAGGTESTLVLDVAHGPTLVAALCQVTARRPGRADLDNETLHLHRVVDGRIVEVWFRNADQAAVDAFWGAS